MEQVGRMMTVTALLAMVLGIVTAASLALPRPASAAPADCPYRNFCAYSRESYGDRIYFYEGSDVNWHNDPRAADNAWSVFNNGSSGGVDDVIAYEHVSYGGAGLCVRNQSGFPALRQIPKWTGGTWGADANNAGGVISSHRWVTNC